MIWYNLPSIDEFSHFLFNTVMSKISLFPSGIFSPSKGGYVPATTPTDILEFDDYLNFIHMGEWQDEVLAYRAGRIEKGMLKGITASGLFKKRNANDLIEHSGFIAIDIDVKDQMIEIESVIGQLKSDPYTYALHRSAGGFGYVCYFKIDTTRHLDAFYGIERYFATNYQLIIDKSCKDVPRYRFVSFDPYLYKNGKAKTFKEYIKKSAKPVVTSYIHSESDIQHVLEQIRQFSIDLVDSYDDWLKVGFALESKYGAGGREMFHTVSQQNSKYDAKECDKLFDIILKRGSDKSVTIGTFFWMCKMAGVEIKTEQTEKIERIAKQQRKSVGTSGGAKNVQEAKINTLRYLEDVEGIQNADDVVDQVMQLSEKDLSQKSDSPLEDLKTFISSLRLRFNEITRRVEMNGEPLGDRELNSIYVRALETIDDKLSKDKLLTIIDSDFVPSYNPFTQFFSKYSEIQSTGEIDKLLDAVIPNGTQVAHDFHRHFMRKWLISVVASMHGTYSLLILVLTGGQGNGKTQFFRELLPDDLFQYYAESALDEGKDSELLLTTKILVMDDEFGGKSKQDAKRLKELSSKQWFNIRRPYGRTTEDLKRLGVLCGTSNETEVINDPTGNRRIIPININRIDLDVYRSVDKVKLWIELYNEWKSIQDGWMLTEAEILSLRDCTAVNEQISAEEELVLKYYQVEPHGFEIEMMNTEIKAYLEMKTGQRISGMKLGLVLKKLGFVKKSVKRNGSSRSVYLMYESN